MYKLWWGMINKIQIIQKEGLLEGLLQNEPEHISIHILFSPVNISALFGIWKTYCHLGVNMALRRNLVICHQEKTFFFKLQS